MEKQMDKIISVFSSITDKRTMRKLFDELLTESERKNLSLRWKLLEELSKNTPQREIAKSLHLSLCKITRGSKILKDKKSVCSKLLKKTSPKQHNTP